MLLLAGITAVSFAADTLFDQRFNRWKKQAENGNKRAQYKLGNAYLRGNEVKVNIAKAIKWFKKSADQGYVKAAHKLGMIYYFNKDGSRNYGKAFKWFAMAAKRQHAEAQYYLGKMYFEGRGVRKNNERALFWLKRAESLDFLAAAREVRKVQKAIKKSRRNTADRKPDAKPASKPTAGNRPPPKPLAPTKSKSYNSRRILFAGKWVYNGKPAEELPSAITKCTVSEKQAKCLTARLKTKTKSAEISYQVESSYTNFTSRGSFNVTYRKNYLFVLPNDPDDPEPDADIPAMGWQKESSQLRCHVVNRRLINCTTKDLKIRRYTKQ